MQKSVNFATPFERIYCISVVKYRKLQNSKNTTIRLLSVKGSWNPSVDS